MSTTSAHTPSAHMAVAAPKKAPLPAEGAARSHVIGLSADVPPIELLREFGPGQTAGPVSTAAAREYGRSLAVSHYENFSVLSALVPERLRDDFAAVYAFCRWSDDLADETGNDESARSRSLELLAWWRGELAGCFDLSTKPRHPVFTALRETVLRHGVASGAKPACLSVRPFHDLLDAFEQDQRVRAYETWEQVIGYCERSANPVGRIVLALGGYAPPEIDVANARRYELSDATCTALQLINFWQDVRRDLLERDRVYVPSAETGLTPERLREWAGTPDDPTARVRFIKALRPLVERTAELFAHGRVLPSLLDSELRPVVWLFGAGGEAILSAVERIGCSTLWQRPRLSAATKGLLVGRAWLKARVGFP